MTYIIKTRTGSIKLPPTHDIDEAKANCNESAGEYIVLVFA